MTLSGPLISDSISNVCLYQYDRSCNATASFLHYNRVKHLVGDSTTSH